MSCWGMAGEILVLLHRSAFAKVYNPRLVSPNKYSIMQYSTVKVIQSDSVVFVNFNHIIGNHVFKCCLSYNQFTLSGINLRRFVFTPNAILSILIRFTTNS